MNNFDEEYTAYSASLPDSEKSDVFPLGAISDAATIAIVAQVRKALGSESSVTPIRKPGERGLSIEPKVHGNTLELRKQWIAGLAKHAIDSANRARS